MSTSHTEQQASIAPLHRDDPTILDGLDRRSIVRDIATRLATEKLPVIFGLHGDWGAGKTSALRAVQHVLTGHDHHTEGPEDLTGGIYSNSTVTVWFEAWRYQNEASPLAALLQEMRRQFSLSKRIKSNAKKLGEVTFRSLLGTLDDAAKIIGLENTPVSLTKIQSIGEQYEREKLQSTLQTDTIQEHLTDTIGALLPKSQKGSPTPRVIIFVDDLDRCHPDSAFRLLEGLKIYMNLPNCAFILGMNQRTVIEFIAHQSKRDPRDSNILLDAEAYLEKLCNHIWRLPLPAKPIGYFKSLVSSPSARAALPGDDDETTPPYLPPNPRRLRALANVYNRLITYTEHLEPTVKDELFFNRLLVVAYVYQFHSELYLRWVYEPNFFISMLNWALRTDNKSDPPFQSFSLPTRPAMSTASFPAGAAEIASNYPDPAGPGVFWIAPLLQTKLANSTPGDFLKMLELRV